MGQLCDETCKSDGDTEKKSNKGSEKVFIIRESYYTTLLENKHLKSVYNVFVAIFMFMLLDSVLHDLLTDGRIYLGLRTIRTGFGKFHIALVVWCVIQILVIGLYYALETWVKVSRNLKENAVLQSFWNYCCVITFAGFQFTFLYVSITTCVTNELPFATTFALLMETMRLIMKGHAFIRSNVPRLLGYSQSQDQTLQLAPISTYLYFLFAPTFLYRDTYPRTDKIRWSFAMRNLLDAVLGVFLFSFVYERHILPKFGDFGTKRLTGAELTEKYISMVLPSCLSLVGSGYVILHCWLNFAAEVLRFGDRLFYKDWWTTASYGTYYRSWNLVIHECLLEYIYKDIYMYIFKGSKLCSILMVFYLSVVMHELAISFALKMFYPVLSVFFGGIGVVFYFATKKLPHGFGNAFFWFTYLMGITGVICLYAMEYFARMNTLRVSSDSWMQELTQTPASWNFNRWIAK